MKTQINSDPHAIIIGGGATGCGVGRDLAMRGFRVTLIEFDDLGSGTSSRFHGMLQSGGRYAVSDTDYGAECMRERRIIADIAPQVVEKTGGYFVSLASDPTDYADQFLKCCGVADIPAKELDPKMVMEAEPAISREVKRAFSVPDATIQSWRLVNLLADDIRRRGGKVLTRHQVTAIVHKGGKVKHITVWGPEGEKTLEADIVVNAAGPWSARVAALAGEKTNLELGKGSLLVFSHRMTTKAVNRCRPPTSHDIIVPTGTVSLFGTTSEVVDDPDTTHVRPEEIQELLENAEDLLPDAKRYRAFRAWAGVRPLFRPKNWPSDQPLPRRHSIINHGNNEIDGFFTICGGSLTTHRSMAEDLGDTICQSLGLDRPCETATTSLVAGTEQTSWHPAGNFHKLERSRDFKKAICECESVERDDILALVKTKNIIRLNDLRRRLRVGVGPCQGTFCGSRVAAMIASQYPDYSAIEDLSDFWTERLKGSRYTNWGHQAKQTLLSDAVYRETMGIRLPDEDLSFGERR